MLGHTLFAFVVVCVCVHSSLHRLPTLSYQVCYCRLRLLLQYDPVWMYTCSTIESLLGMFWFDPKYVIIEHSLRRQTMPMGLSTTACSGNKHGLQRVGARLFAMGLDRPSCLSLLGSVIHCRAGTYAGLNEGGRRRTAVSCTSSMVGFAHLATGICTVAAVSVKNVADGAALKRTNIMSITYSTSSSCSLLIVLNNMTPRIHPSFGNFFVAWDSGAVEYCDSGAVI